MTYNVFSGTLNPTHFTSHVGLRYFRHRSVEPKFATFLCALNDFCRDIRHINAATRDDYITVPMSIGTLALGGWVSCHVWYCEE